MPAQTIRAVLSALFLLAGPAAAQSGSLPPGWMVRTDQGGDSTKIGFVTMEPGYHITPGPAAIFYRTEDRAQGPFHTLARFQQMKETRHPEGYGLFVGGQDLAGKNQRYLYFLVRGDGSYLIKQRKGDTTSEISKGWVPHAAVKKVVQGKATNLLEVDAKQDPSKIEFKVNGQTVYSTAAKQLDLKGVVGLRVNHNLDVHIEDFAVHQ
jgi:hypothetical protein